MVSHPETGSDSPIGSDRYRGRDSYHLNWPEYMTSFMFLCFENIWHILHMC